MAIISRGPRCHLLQTYVEEDEPVPLGSHGCPVSKQNNHLMIEGDRRED